MTIDGKRVTENIYLCPDGYYRWVYEFPMLRNPAILLTIWKMFGIVILLQILLSFLMELVRGSISLWVRDYLLSPGILILPEILFALSILAYLILAGIYGWKYMILFEMNEEQIVHMQMPKQFEKAQALGWLTAMTGLAAGNYTAAGAGMLSSAKNSMSSEFKNVKILIGRRSLHLIKVNGVLNHNQVYALPQDYEFVWNYITTHCANAKIR